MLIHSQSMRRRPARFAAGALALAALLGASGVAHADAVVRQVSGTVEIGRGEPPVWGPLEAGAHVAPDERIRTGGDGRVELVVDAATLRVHENSLLRLPPSLEKTDRVVLERGHSLFDVLRREGHAFEVRTPTVVVSVKGTRFAVESNDEAGVVSVYRGVVGVRPTDEEGLAETLVREGFLATGGGGLPLELDVVPPGDPWSEWQESNGGSNAKTAPTKRESEVERARTSVRQAVDADVVKRAAERKPEIADRLNTLVGSATDPLLGTTDSRDATTTETSLPASPDLIETVDDTTRLIIDSTLAEDSLERTLSAIDTEAMTGGLPFPSGETTLSQTVIETLDPTVLVQLVDVLGDMQTEFDASPTAGTPDTFATDLTTKLVEEGMDAISADRLVGRLVGSILP